MLQLLALLSALLGLGLVILHKEQLGKAHLATWHGQAGLLAVLWAGLQCAGGVGLLYPKLLPRWPLAKLKLYHATSGLVGYLLGSTSLLLGMCSLWFTASVTGGAWYLAVLCPVHQLGRHEPGEQCVPIPQEDPAMSSSQPRGSWEGSFFRIGAGVRSLLDCLC